MCIVSNSPLSQMSLVANTYRCRLICMINWVGVHLRWGERSSNALTLKEKIDVLAVENYSCVQSVIYRLISMCVDLPAQLSVYKITKEMVVNYLFYLHPWSLSGNNSQYKIIRMILTEMRNLRAIRLCFFLNKFNLIILNHA